MFTSEIENHMINNPLKLSAMLIAVMLANIYSLSIFCSPPESLTRQDNILARQTGVKKLPPPQMRKVKPVNKKPVLIPKDKEKEQKEGKSDSDSSKDQKKPKKDEGHY